MRLLYDTLRSSDYVVAGTLGDLEEADQMVSYHWSYMQSTCFAS
ncbi:MAG: hypothetical protein JWP08_4103 [Bryobacterales bacterium]|jgi:hypothetical protein|nr:hypothetical protein [Bryobacterales bacterium]